MTNGSVQADRILVIGYHFTPLEPAIMVTMEASEVDEFIVKQKSEPVNTALRFCVVPLLTADEEMYPLKACERMQSSWEFSGVVI